MDSESTNLEYLFNDKSRLASLVRRLFCILHVCAVINCTNGWQHMEATTIQLMADAENKEGTETSQTSQSVEAHLEQMGSFFFILFLLIQV